MLTSFGYQVLLPTFLSVRYAARRHRSLCQRLHCKKCSDFIGIFQGKTATTIPVDPVVPSCDLQGDVHLYQTVAIKRLGLTRRIKI